METSSQLSVHWDLPSVTECALSERPCALGPLRGEGAGGGSLRAGDGAEVGTPGPLSFFTATCWATCSSGLPFYGLDEKRKKTSIVNQIYAD